jgi:hypothetical protein
MDTKLRFIHKGIDMELDNTYESYMVINWLGYDGEYHSRVVPAEWGKEYLRATLKMTPNQDSIKACEVY